MEGPVGDNSQNTLFAERLEGHIAAMLTDPLSSGAMIASRLLQVAEYVNLRLNLWRAQTLFVQVCRRHLHDLLRRRGDDKMVARQLTVLRQLGEQLHFAVIEDLPLDTWESA